MADHQEGAVYEDDYADPPPTGMPAAVARQAVEWWVELAAPQCDDRARQRFLYWRQAHPDHERAWLHIERMAGRLQTLNAPLASQVAQTALLTRHPLKRRAAIKTLAGVLFVGGAGWSAQRYSHWRGWSADQHTGIGERRTITLDDGSTLTLNTDSVVDIRFDAEVRELHLVRGEILLATAADPRPFRVATAQGWLRPLGTRFAVREYPDRSRLEVFQGAVEIRLRDAPGSGRTVQAGERAIYRRAGVEPVTPLTASAGAWAQGMLVADRTRLADFIAELGRYRPGVVNCDPQIAGLRLSGTYPLADTNRILASLSATLPVRIQFITRYWVRVMPRTA